jgi:hypothetical protein
VGSADGLGAVVALLVGILGAVSGVPVLQAIGIALAVMGFFVQGFCWVALVGLGPPTSKRWNRDRTARPSRPRELPPKDM